MILQEIDSPRLPSDQSSDHCKRITLDESVSANLHSACLPLIIKKAFLLCFNVDGLSVDNS